MDVHTPAGQPTQTDTPPIPPALAHLSSSSSDERRTGDLLVVLDVDDAGID